MVLRSCFTVTGNLKFLSHLDTLKLIERSLRRADIPVAFSQGFNPHPKIAFGPARPVGLSSEEEYFDVELNRPMVPEEFRDRLQEKCPKGILIKITKEVPAGTPALMAILNCATYQATLTYPSGLTQEEVDQKIQNLFSHEEIIVERISPKKRKEYDIRPGILKLTACLQQQSLIFDMELMIGNQGNVKPGEVINSLYLNNCKILGIHRTGLFIIKQNGDREKPI